MKKLFAGIVKIVRIIIGIFLPGTNPIRRRNKVIPVKSVNFTGYVRATNGTPVKAAKVKICGEVTETDSAGYFKLSAPPVGRYIVNIYKEGYGLISRILKAGLTGGVFVLEKGYTETVDPKKGVNIKTPDTMVPAATLSQRVDWKKYPKQAIPSARGNSKGDFPEKLKKAMKIHDEENLFNSGFSVVIPPDSLVDEKGNAPKGKVNVTISDVQLIAPGSMPGDYTATGDAGEGFMVSFGAGKVYIYDDQAAYNLRKGSTAKLSIPVDKVLVKFAEDRIPSEIQSFIYNRTRGIWEQIGTLNYKKGDAAFEAETSHFSEFNADLIKTDQSCICLYSQIAGPYRLEVTIPMEETGPVVRYYDVEDDTPLHALYNLPNYTDVTLRAFREQTDGTVIPLGTFVANTNGPQDPTRPNRPVYPYNACKAFLTVYDESIVENKPFLTVFGGSSGISPDREFNLLWLYAWEDEAGLDSGDIFELEESVDPGSGFSPIGTYPHTETGVRLQREYGTYWYRVRTREDGNYSAYSDPIKVDVQEVSETRTLTVENDLGSSTTFRKVVRFRYAQTEDLLYNDPDTEQLDRDDYCRSTPGNSINSGETISFDVSSIPFYYEVYIGLGDWVQNQGACTGDRYSKKLFYDYSDRSRHIFARFAVLHPFGDIHIRLYREGYNLKWHVGYTTGNFHLSDIDPIVS